MNSAPSAVNRRCFLKSTAAAVCAPAIVRSAEAEILGQGEHRYRVVPGWGVLDDKTPVKNCHGIICTEEDRHAGWLVPWWHSLCMKLC